MSKLIAVDVDLTVVDTLTPWMQWFENITGGIPVKNESGDYDLVPEMKQILTSVGRKDINPFDFWKLPDLYDNLRPLDWAEMAILDLVRQGHKVVFVSSCVPEHLNSKVDFLARYFARNHGFIDTVQKHFVAYDVLIDDKLAHIRKGQLYRPAAKHILFTGVRADGTPEQRQYWDHMTSWGEVNTKLGF